jgi:hypothetical protein
MSATFSPPLNIFTPRLRHYFRYDTPRRLRRLRASVLRVDAAASAFRHADAPPCHCRRRLRREFSMPPFAADTLPDSRLFLSRLPSASHRRQMSRHYFRRWLSADADLLPLRHATLSVSFSFDTLPIAENDSWPCRRQLSAADIDAAII